MTTPAPFGSAAISSVESRLSWERIALASGIVFALVQLAAVAFFGAAAAPHMPSLDAPFAEHAAFYTQYWETLAIANYLYVLPIPFFLLFLGGLFEVLRRAEGQAGVLTTATMSAGVALAMVWPLGIVVASSGQSMAKEGLDGAAVFAFDNAAQLSLALSGFPRAVLLAGTSFALLAAGIGPRWIGWTGIGLAVVALATTATLVVSEVYPFLAIGMLLFHVWVVALCAVLLRRGAPAPQPMGAGRAALSAT
jgi:hypothetical protein